MKSATGVATSRSIKKNGASKEESSLEWQLVNQKLAGLGQPTFGEFSSFDQEGQIARGLCPADQRIQNYLNRILKNVSGKNVPVLPSNTFVLDKAGLARTLSLPPDIDSFESNMVKSFRVQQGVLHNPKHDRRTTKGVFHVAEEGLPIPDDKLSVPIKVFANLLKEALQPPDDLATLPFTASQKKKAHLFVSLLLRPLVQPRIEGILPELRTEVRFFAPGSLVSNLDFVESIFGNGGDPYLSDNDAGLGVEGWTGHTGCVILAPHLIKLKKKDLGLPNIKNATQRQKRDGMCWSNKNELYNGGSAFKITSRDKSGVMVTIIADNYYGYCKKEVKTQIGFSANLSGLCEEEHAGGAIAYPSYNLGQETHPDNTLPWNRMNFENMVRRYKKIMDVHDHGYAVDKKYPDIIFVPENAKFSLKTHDITWKQGSKKRKIKLLRDHVYLLPSGYKIHMERLSSGTAWRLIGTRATGTLCHKPCTVSGGGKSEISKSISDSMIQGPVYTANLEDDLHMVSQILQYDFGKRFKSKKRWKKESRPILSLDRSLGSVIKLLTPSSSYTEEYNDWLQSWPNHVIDIVYILKRVYRKEWGQKWASQFSVDIINNHPGHELKVGGKKVIAHYIRVGFEKSGWRLFKLRSDYSPAFKVQVEDDITASVVLPSNKLKGLNKEYTNPSFKFVQNCESRLFQRPDEAIHRGYDKQAEADIATPNTFLSNYEPLTHRHAKDFIEDAITFDLYTEPVKKLISDFSEKGKNNYFVSSAHPRIVNGKPSKNPRYLQNRLDLMDEKGTYLSLLSERLYRQVPLNQPVHMPVNVVLPGRRNNSPDSKAGIPALAVYSPIHYQELPELFIDFICSVTGKSPSTTGFGSEGALTKGPFNAINATTDLNNALLSYILTGYQGFSSAAGTVGPNVRVDHDVSLLMPEIWCRMTKEERDPNYLIKNGCLEKLEDFYHEGRLVKASYLGYRITQNFVIAFMGRIFNKPNVVFTEEMLKPELQSLDLFCEGIDNIVTTQKIVAKHYFEDGGIANACPPLKALLHIMAKGHYNGLKLEDPKVRDLFNPVKVLSSSWYKKRLVSKANYDKKLWKKHLAYLSQRRSRVTGTSKVELSALDKKIQFSKQNIKKVSTASYLNSLKGTIGRDSIYGS